MYEIDRSEHYQHNQLSLATQTGGDRLAASSLFYMLVFYAASILYIIPHTTFPHAKVSLPILAALLFFELLYGKTKLYRGDFILILALLMVSLLNFSSTRLGDAIIISILLIKCRNAQLLKRKYGFYLHLLAIASIVIQLLIYRKGNVPVLSVGDPNFSSLNMLLFLFFCWKNQFKPGILISLFTAFIFLSRAYFLSLLIFFLLLFFDKKVSKLSISRPIINFFLGKGKFLLVLVAANLLLLFISVQFIENVEIAETNSTVREISRLRSLNDSSNHKRFMANYQFINLMREDTDIALFGLPDELSSDKEFESILDSEVVVHNGLLYIIAQRGILFCLFYFIALGKIIKRLYTRENLKYILSFLSFSLFLHITFTGPRLIFFVTTLALPQIKLIAKRKSLGY